MLAQLGHPFVAHVLVSCAFCDKWIAHESRHNCAMPPDYRETRAAERARFVTQLRAEGHVLSEYADEL